MLQTLLRLLRILSVFIRFRLDVFLPFEKMPWYLRWTLGSLSKLLHPTEKRSRGVRLRLALESLGPIFVKFGQLLSTRRDLLDDDVADELAHLQDKVPPFSGKLARSIIEESFGKSVTELFQTFSSEPLASASIAQVHTATLHDGAQVVVKVIRPKIETTIQRDLSLLYLVAKLLVRFSADGRRLRPMEVVEDYEHTILDELDLTREAANTAQLQRNFEKSPLLYVPDVYWDYSRRNVMVVERISGIPVADVKKLNAANVDMKCLAERGVEIFFTQVFNHSFFHADMHPGNIFVNAENPNSPQYIAIDCAIMGSLSNEDKNYLARNLLAFFKRDYRLVAQLHVESGWVPKETPVHAFESAIRSVCEPMFAKPLKDISFGQVLIGLFQTARRFNMEVQPQLVLLEKTMLNIEGLGRQLYPELDLWQTAQPFLEKWLKEELGPKRVINEIKQQAPEWAGHFPQIPNLLFSALTQYKQQQSLEQEHTAELRKIRKEMAERRRLVPFKALGAVTLLCAWVSLSPDFSKLLQQADWLTLALTLTGLYLLVLKT